MGAKLVKIIEEKGMKTLASGSVLHKYVADLIVDGAEVAGAKVAVWGNAENDAFKAGTEMSSRLKDDQFGQEYNLSGAAKAGPAGGGARGGGFAARPPRFEDTEAGFLARQRGILWCNAVTAAATGLGPLASADLIIEWSTAIYKAGEKLVK